jgi:hypothetical protein
MRSFFIALIEVDSHPGEYEGRAYVKAMHDFKEAGQKIGNVTYYRVTEESQYRKAEKEFKAQVQKNVETP